MTKRCLSKTCSNPATILFIESHDDIYLALCDKHWAPLATHLRTHNNCENHDDESLLVVKNTDSSQNVQHDNKIRTLCSKYAKAIRGTFR